MLLKLTERLHLDGSLDDVWTLLRDASGLTGFLPGVESVAPLNDEGVEAYVAKVRDRIGPFKLTLDIDVRVVETHEPLLLRATIKGADSSGHNRVTGTMEVALSAASSGTEMRFEASIDVLGKLATLGAVPVRRRATQLFAAFARNIHGQFVTEDP